MRIQYAGLWVVLLGGCAKLPSPAVFEPVGVSPQMVSPAMGDAWTADPFIPFVHPTWEGTHYLSLFTRLDLIARDSAGWRVRCALCAEPLEARVSEAQIARTPHPPEVAAWGSLAEFALSIRKAAQSISTELLPPVMVADFTYGLIGPQNPAMAIEVWRSTSFETLRQLPALLDKGLTTRDSVIWSAPPAFNHDLSYRGPRAGFRRSADGRWEWIFFTSGIVPN